MDVQKKQRIENYCDLKKKSIDYVNNDADDAECLNNTIRFKLNKIDNPETSYSIMNDNTDRLYRVNIYYVYIKIIMIIIIFILIIKYIYNG